MLQNRVAVIGGGISGLACALRLSQQGFQVTTFERELAVGGRMNTRVKDGFSFDLGADAMMGCYSGVEQLARSVGVEVQSIGLVRHVFLRRGEMHNMNFASIGDVMRFGGISVISRVRLLLFSAYVLWRYPDLDFFDLSTIPESLKGSNAYEYCKMVVGSEFADYIVDPFTTCMMFYRSREMSAGAFVSLFSMMMKNRDSFGVRRALGAVRALPVAIAARLDVRTGASVDLVQHHGGRIVVRSHGATTDFDAVVLATPASATLALLRDPTATARALLEQTTYSQTVDVRFRIPEDALHGVHCYYVPFVESEIISEITNEAVKGAETVHEGWIIVSVGLHDEAARRLIDQTDDEIFAAVKKELVRISLEVAAVAERLLPHDLQRLHQAIPRYTPGQLARVEAFWRDGQGQGNVFLCGDYLNHPWLEGAVRCGNRVAAMVVERMPALPALEPATLLPALKWSASALISG